MTSEAEKLLTVVETICEYDTLSDWGYILRSLKHKNINIDDILISILQKEKSCQFSCRKIRMIVTGIQNPKPSLELTKTLKLLNNNMPDQINNKLIRLTKSITEEDYQKNYEILHPYFAVIRSTFKEVNTDGTKLLNELNKPTVMDKIKNGKALTDNDFTELSVDDFESYIENHNFSAARFLKSKKLLRFLLDHDDYFDAFTSRFFSFQKKRYYVGEEMLEVIYKSISDENLKDEFLRRFSAKDLINTSNCINPKSYYDKNFHFQNRYVSMYQYGVLPASESLVIIRDMIVPLISNKSEQEKIKKNIDFLLSNENYTRFEIKAADTDKFAIDETFPDVYKILSMDDISKCIGSIKFIK